MSKLYSVNFKRQRISWRCLFILASLLLLLMFHPDRALARKSTQTPAVIELNLKEASLKMALKEIERQTDYHFVINESRLGTVRKSVTLNIKTENVEEVLNQLLSGTNITYKIRKKQITLIPPANDAAVSPIASSPGGSTAMLTDSQVSFLYEGPFKQDVTVRGTVKEETGAALPGVNVVVKGTTQGTVTDGDGNFSLNVPSNESVLVFSFIGFVTQEVAVNGQTTIDVVLISDSETLSEVVVVGYGTQEKKDVTGAVSAVKGSDIANIPSGGAQQALQGRAAGVTIVRNGGAPGNAGSIRIRGLGTVNNADPLVVIDGVPAGGINDVNPNDIESIDVLKDASASAIYGTRAANGVVLITTKRGKFDDKLRLTVNGYTGVSNRIKTIDVLDAPTLAQLKQEAYTNDGVPIPAVWEDAQYQTQKTNWQDELLKQGTTNNVDISIMGGGKSSSFALSGGYYNEKGIIGKSYYKRYTFRINSDHKISERLKIGQSFQYTNTNDNAPNTLSAQDGLLWSAIRFHPGLPVKNADGSYGSTQGLGAFGDINNPIYTVDIQDKNTSRNRFLGSVTGELELFKGLKAKANVAMDGTFFYDRNFEVKISDQFRQNSYNQLTIRNEKYWSFLQEYFLTYDKQIGDHAFTLVGGYTSQTADGLYTKQQGRDFASEDPDLRYMGKANTIVNLSGDNGGRSYDALESWFGRANYSFKERYLLTATFRADGSSRFAEGNKWGNFPAFSLGWRISEEPFFQGSVPFISNLKFTGGWGQLGNQNVTSLQYLALINSGYRYTFGDGQPQNQVSGSAQGRIPNPNIGWETAEMTNFGLDAGFLENALSLSLNYFIKDTKKMLLSPPSVGTLGRASIPDKNVGELRNQGLELEASYRRSVGDFTFALSGNATFIKNEVTKLLTPGSFLASQTYGRTEQEITRTYEGNAYGTFYGWETDGLYQNQNEIDTDPNIADDPRRGQGLIQPGDVRFRDLTNDGVIDDKDRTILGSPQPKITYGLNANVGYKGFDLTLFFLGVGGVDIYNADRMQGLNAAYSFNLYAEATNRWTDEGTSNSIPRVSSTDPNRNFRTSDLFIESGAFLRLKNITLGYTLPKNITDVLRMSQARIYVTGQNVFTVTDYSGLNPELGYADGNRSAGQYTQQNVDYAQYPQSRTWTVGATLSF
jgi:TonB-dependent starch-binding outer membrane protein SusC